MKMTHTDSDAVANTIMLQLREEFLTDSQSRLEKLDACIADGDRG